jgi:UMF1 family MFS transporter
MYDFANSGYTTVVITAVYNAYFVAVIAGNAAWATFAWSAALALSYLAIMLSAPVLGAIADASGAKKRLLGITTVGCVLATTALSLPQPGQIVWAMVLIAVSNFFFGTGENLIAAFLPELARGRALGRISGLGWGVGFLGGIVSLGLALAYVSHVQSAGGGATQFVPGVLLITAGLFVLSSLPTFLLLRERAQPRPLQAGLSHGAYAQLLHSLRQLRQFQDLRRFLYCIVFYQAGVMAVIALAAVYAQQAMHFDTRQTIELILVVNVTAALGALGFGHVQDRIGHKAALTITLIAWLCMIALAYSATTTTRFWLAANLAGLSLGASQSAGRALVGYLSPKTHRAEFFGLWGLAVKLSSIFGPISYGAAVWLSEGNHRLGMLFIGVFFVVGLMVLMDVDVRRGRKAALRMNGVQSRNAADAKPGDL